ncbi:MAG: PsbP-related protein [Candidatus Daviesbacteria bacterium]|nr:PsbP-related protein [Candidatus Daviesbacteria bacterium]
MVNKKLILLLVVIIVLIIGIVLVLMRSQQKDSQSNPFAESTFTKITPSEAFIEYSDPSGFSFSYPDNLSLDKKVSEDEAAYADLLLSAKGVNGSLSLRIADSELDSIDEWVKVNQTSFKEDPKEVKLGNLPALEINLNDRIITGALDQGVLFTLEMPKIEEEFWMKVYQKILTDFSFTTPEAESVVSSDDVIFEGEEVVE